MTINQISKSFTELSSLLFWQQLARWSNQTSIQLEV